MLEFEGRVAVVTGAGAGLGRGYATALAAAGAHVVVNDIAGAEQVAAEIERAGGSATAASGSVADEAQATAVIERTLDRHGRLDILINNAGNTRRGRVQDLATASFEDVLAVHLYGSFWTMRAALKAMRAAGYGRIVNTTSALGAFGFPGAAPYVVAKAALIGLTKTASLENLDRNIRINAIAPIAETALAGGFFAANPTLNAAHFRVEDVVPVVTFLAHADCNVTGQIVSAGAGRIAAFAHGTGPGIFEPGIAADEVGSRLPEILAPDDLIFPASALDEFILVNV